MSVKPRTYAYEKDYFISEGNKIGYMSEYDLDTLDQKKIIAGEDLHKGQLVYVSDNFKVKACDTSHGEAIGVVMLSVKSGEPVAIETEGLFRITAGETITAGDKLSAGQYTDSASVTHKGVAKKATEMSQDSSTKAVTLPTKTIGVALNGATAGGDVYVKFTI